MFQSETFCTVSLVDISSFKIQCCVSWIPHLPTSVVSHDDRQNSYGCVGARLGP